MDLLRILLVMSGLFFLSVDQSEADFPLHVLYQEGYSWTGNFKIPRALFKEGRTLNLFERIILAEGYHWDISIKVGEVISVQGRPSIDPFRYVEMKVFCYECSMDMAYFTTRSSHHNVGGVIVVDSISWSDGVITVKRGQDKMVLNIEMDENCGRLREWTMPWHESWYSPYHSLDNCKIYDINPDECDTAREYLRKSGKRINDICFANVYDGDSCGMSMVIMRMTGIFRQKSLLMTATPPEQVSISGYYLNGTKDFNIFYPCLLDIAGFPKACQKRLN